MSTATLALHNPRLVPSVDERVAILGTGPAALAVALAAEIAGLVPSFFGRIQKSEIHGCQYLHRDMPYFPAKQVDVGYQLLGTAEGYRERVYGLNWDGPVSPEDLTEEHTAWDIRETYDKMWYRYSSGYELFHWEITPRGISESYRALIDNFAYAISTVPATALCWDASHQFKTAEIWAWGESPGNKPFLTIPDNTVICNGDVETRYRTWYRASRVFGRTTVEWPGDIDQPHGTKRVLKPLSTNCTCASGIVRLGRYGAWDKSVLVHNVYEQATELFNARRADPGLYRRP